LAQLNTHLIRPGYLDWMSVLEKMSSNPARLLGQPGGSLGVGDWADVIVIDPNALWTVHASAFQSKSYNTPLEGHELFGTVRYTLVAGRVRNNPPKSS
jgi:dihydroorotase